MIIGVDNGNSNVKIGINSGGLNLGPEDTTFTAGLIEHDLQPPLSKELLFWNNKYYTLTNERGKYEMNKTNNDKAYVLTLFGIAKHILLQNAYTDEEIEVDLAVGLPPEHHAILRDDFRNYFFKYGSHIEFSYSDKPFKIKLNTVNVYPQAYSAVASTDLIKKVANYTTCYIVDIGGYTTDIILLHEGVPDLSHLRSLETGIIRMNNTIIGKVNANTGSRITESHIYDVLMGRENILSKKIKDIIKGEAKKHADLIINDLREHGIDLTTSPSVFVGGGTLLLKDYIENNDSIASAYIVDDISANASGYEVLNSLVLSRGK